MGLCKSKGEPVDEHDTLVFDKSKIRFDEYGNLIYDGLDAPDVDREAEAKAIMTAEVAVDDKTPGQTWWIVDSTWVEMWLHYVQITPDCPRPGPCRNDRLVEKDEQGIWVGRRNMQMAVRSRKGDYRRVTEETWKQINVYYPGSGPCITMNYTYNENLQDSGTYDVSSWVITPDGAMNANSKPRKLLHHMGNTFKILTGSKRLKADDAKPADTTASPSPNVEDAGSSSGAAGQSRTSEPDSDDDDEEAPLDKSKKPAASSQGSTKIVMSRSFLGSKAGNEAKDPSNYKKVGASSSDRESNELEGGAMIAKEPEDTRRESFFTDVFFGSNKQE